MLHSIALTAFSHHYLDPTIPSQRRKKRHKSKIASRLGSISFLAKCNETWKCQTKGFGAKASDQWLIGIEDTKEENYAAIGGVTSSSTHKTQTHASKGSMCGMSTGKSKGKRFNLRIGERRLFRYIHIVKLILWT